jgi:prevent-host-death family protein
MLDLRNSWTISTSRFDQSEGGMTREVQASEAKTHLPQLLDEVERGETIIITRHGRAIARIIPEAHQRQEEIDQAIGDIKELGKETGKASIEEILSLIREGRKY